MLHCRPVQLGVFQEGIPVPAVGRPCLPLGATLRAAGVIPAIVGLTFQGQPTHPLGMTLIHSFYSRKENKLGLLKCFYFSPHIRKVVVELVKIDEMPPTEKEK